MAPRSTVVTAAMLVVMAVATFAAFASQGRMSIAIMLGFIVPVGAAWEWRAARDRSEAEGAVAERMASIIAAALLVAATIAL